MITNQQAPAGEAAHTVTISRSHTGEGGNVVQKYLQGHEALLAGGAGYKSLLVLDGEAEAYIHVTAIKVRTRGHPLDITILYPPENKSTNSTLPCTCKKVRLTKVMPQWDAAHPSCDSPNTARRFARLVQVVPAWSVKTRRARSRHCRDAKVCGHSTMVMHDMRRPPTP